MKNARISTVVALCGVLFTLAATASAQTAKQGLATVVRIQGEARYSIGDGTWHPLVAGKVLAAGSVIQTAHDAYVDVVLGKSIEMPQAAAWPDQISLAPDSFVRGMVDYKPSVEQNMVRLTSDTTLAIDKLTVSDTGVDSVSDTELNLTHGRVFCTVKKLSATSQYLVKIPNGIAGVRGTCFGIGADGWCACYTHSVLFSFIGPNGVPTTITVDQGSLFDPATGQTSSLPPGLITLFSDISRALDTLYVQICSFAFDRTWCHISSTSGHGGRGDNPGPGHVPPGGFQPGPGV
jgi:hypothetical protein